MNKFIELEDLTMHAKPFHVLSLIKGEKHQLKHANNNYILFVISGRLTLKDKRGNEQYLHPEHMYALKCPIFHTMTFSNHICNTFSY